MGSWPGPHSITEHNAKGAERATLGGTITDDGLKELLEQVVRDRDEANGVQGDEWRYGDQEPLAGEAAIAAMRRAYNLGSATENAYARTCREMRDRDTD